MRIGVMARAETEEFNRMQALGFRALEWVRFDTGPCGAGNADWKPHADWVAAETRQRGLCLSAIAALYANPLDPAQAEHARATFHRAIEVASHIGVKTVAGFAGAVIRTRIHERGGNPVYEPLENFLPEVLAFWEPIAHFAADRGVRIAFENCPQGPYHLPVMHYNLMGQPAMWERLFDATRCENLGLEWDPSHFVCQFIDPVPNIHRFGRRIFHVHAKDAFIDPSRLAEHGICDWRVAEHRFPGFGQSDWAEIVHALVRAGYDSDLSVEGMHDPVFRDHEADENGPLAGAKLEDAGLLLARRFLEQFVAEGR